MKVLGYLIVQFVVRLVRASGEIIATWSLDTVNHYPVTRPVRALMEIGCGNVCYKTCGRNRLLDQTDRL